MTSSATVLPAWGNAGVLPPIRPGAHGHAPDRSPYVADLSVVVDRFATSPERIAILDGFMNFRAGLHAVGITSGFQWLNGSFFENVEALENRVPNDIDVVTFFHLPQGETQTTLLQSHVFLFDPIQAKQRYKVDAYTFVLGQPTEHWQVKKIAYWYSMWSHRRDGFWKGFVQVNLNPAQDANAREILNLQKGARHG